MSLRARCCLALVLALAWTVPAVAAAAPGPAGVALDHAWWLVDHEDAQGRDKLWAALGTAYRSGGGSVREAVVGQLLARWARLGTAGASATKLWLGMTPPGQAFHWGEAGTKRLPAEALVGQVLILPAQQVRAEGASAAFVVSGTAPTAIARVSGRPGLSWAPPPASYLVRVREAARTQTSYGATLALKADWLGLVGPQGLSLEPTAAEGLAREWLAGAEGTDPSLLASELAGRRKGMASVTLWRALRNKDHAGLTDALASGADPDAPDAQGERPLMAALRLGDGVALEALLAKKAKADLRDSRGMTALMVAAVGGQNTWVRRLVAAGAPLDGRSPDFEGGPDLGPLLAAGQETALSLAARAGRSEICRTLVEMGASPVQGNSVGDTPLHVAVARLDAATLKALMGPRTDPDPVNQKGLTPLMLLAAMPVAQAEQAQALAIAELLLRAGADPQRQGPGGRSAAALAEANPLSLRALRQRLGSAAQPVAPGTQLGG